MSASDKYLKLKIVSPDGIVFDSNEAISIELPTKTEIITVYADHASIISEIVPGEIFVELEGETIELAVSSGVLVVEPNSHVNLLVDTAERSEDIDLEKALEAKRKAEELMSQNLYLEDIEMAKLESKIQKELARISVGTRRR